MNHENCCCPGCVATRHLMVRVSHPILSHMHDEPLPSMIPIEQALAMRLEEKDMLAGRMIELDLEIKHLRDC